MNVRRQGVHILALAAKPVGCIQGKGGIVVPDFEGSKVFDNLHAAHQGATGADRQIILWVKLGKLSICGC